MKLRVSLAFADLLFGLFAGLLSCATASAADVGVSIQFSQPGVFGRVDIGNLPPPQVIVPQPVIIAPPPPPRIIVGAPPPPPPEPVYMWVPLEHRQHWDRYCHQYHACGHPVYFVNHDWYRRNVVERQHDEHGDRGRGHDHDDRHEDRGRGHDDEHGRGDRDHGRGHDDDRERGRDRDR